MRGREKMENIPHGINPDVINYFSNLEQTSTDPRERLKIHKVVGQLSIGDKVEAIKFLDSRISQREFSIKTSLEYNEEKLRDVQDFMKRCKKISENEKDYSEKDRETYANLFEENKEKEKKLQEEIEEDKERAQKLKEEISRIQKIKEKLETKE